MTDVITLINTGIYSALTGNSNLNALATGGIWHGLAPSTATDNFVIFQLQSGGATSFSPRREADVLYRVEFFSAVESTARRGYGYIDDALNGQMLTLSGWSNFRMQEVGMTVLVENQAGKLFYRYGATYRIRISKDG